MVIDTSAAGSALSALRKQGDGICPICGGAFYRLKGARFCSRSCKLKAAYRRRVAKRRLALGPEVDRSA